ncbi:MAG: hypothetical protein MUC89_23070 [Acetobacteraceae bacterium]|nr:hypothetical protein [Acetobacteraceae bacterium]
MTGARLGREGGQRIRGAQTAVFDLTQLLSQFRVVLTQHALGHQFQQPSLCPGGLGHLCLQPRHPGLPLGIGTD